VWRLLPPLHEGRRGHILQPREFPIGGRGARGRRKLGGSVGPTNRDVWSGIPIVQDTSPTQSVQAWLPDPRARFIITSVGRARELGVPGRNGCSARLRRRRRSVVPLERQNYHSVRHAADRERRWRWPGIRTRRHRLQRPATHAFPSAVARSGRGAGLAIGRSARTDGDRRPALLGGSRKATTKPCTGGDV